MVGDEDFVFFFFFVGLSDPRDRPVSRRNLHLSPSGARVLPLDPPFDRFTVLLSLNSTVQSRNWEVSYGLSGRGSSPTEPKTSTRYTLIITNLFYIWKISEGVDRTLGLPPPPPSYGLNPIAFAVFAKVFFPSGPVPSLRVSAGFGFYRHVLSDVIFPSCNV